ncbi:hypothetical protein J2Y45_005314 [Dyadobacter sp. BE34]|uniref:Secretion system C-terminal sorting domain-containing protein n=1 Tax=Dyadobacter fermentans TaxID=94254 RepID=A0ABU1R4N0_9BACT|nr:MULTISPECIES: FG-GAP-like repeat-containing protein [Dyadobacter]MDR6808336.1 hypothetical protein [Dyadobacter fermentans]MDR7045847.1 hypothetical protein [Dyadobacter sp. BE242]MDR7200160.1 hypothetical protein [Dyadobacter sp. BE34]MDR7218120.1 hypothetical protein [Dyadobacter sp. BE31]MDR7266051.1 hypothetical protein [Dyadobacter sp. BE32]
MKKHYATIIGSTAAIAAFAIFLVLASLVSNREKQTFSIQPEMSKPSLKNDPTGSTLTSIQNEIAKREYHITFDSAHHALQSPNRVHNLRAYYRPGKLSIQNRIDSIGQNFRMELVNEGIYADGHLIAKAESDAVSHNSNDTVAITHQGFAEEFINNQAGIRQNFIIARAPAHTGELSVRLSLYGLHARQQDSDHLVFYSDNGGKQTDRLTYSDLKCWDADGKPLTAGIVLSGKQIEINVDVSNATYPVTIDPIIANGNPANADKTLEINQTSAWLGFSVSTAGDVNGDGYSDVLVGAPKYDNGQADEGAAFLYPGTAGGISLAAKALEFNQAGAQMGYSVSNAGDINKDGYSDVLVGAPYYDYTLSNQGAVFVYYGSSQGLSNGSVQPLYTFQAEANLGISAAVAGDVNSDGFSDILVGAHQYDHGENNEGAALLYYGTANGLGTFELLECNQPGAMMGFAVAGAGDVDGDGFSDVVAGARLYSNGQALEGAAFVFKGSANGVVTANPTVIEGNQADARLGHALSSAGDVNGDGFSDIALGAYQYDKGSSNEGVVMIHLGSVNGVSTVASQTLESDQIEAQFGISVACAGDVNADGFADLIVGARYYDKGQVNEGAAFIYQGSQNGLNATPVSIMESNQVDAWLGSAVAPAGDVNGDGFSDVLVGSYAFDHGQTDEGSVFIWYGQAASTNTNLRELNGYQDNYCNFGQSVASAGDVNGDGFSDIIVGASEFDSGQPNSGAAYIYYGAAWGIDVNSVTKIEHIQGSHLLGYSVSGAGDINGDGYSDVIIGDPSYFVSWDAQKGLIEGAALIFYGSSQGINPNTFSVLKNANQTQCSFGWVVSNAGDVNGDGYDDVVVGDPNYDKQFDEGAAFIYHGSNQGITTAPAFIIEGNQNAEELGFSAASAGDVNGDGFDDIIVGAPFYSNSQTSEGAALIFYGSVSGVGNTNTTLENNVNQAWMGYSVSTAGDLNGDGYGDIIVGCPTTQAGEGAALTYYGSSSGINNNSLKTILTIGEPSYFGNSVSAAGDYNGDGYGDLIVGAVNYSLTNAGSAFMYFGSLTGIYSQIPVKFESNTANSQMGTSVAYAGDANGDGYSDVIVGAPFSNSKGSAFLYKGGNGTDIINNLRLYNTDLTTPINHTQFPQPNFGAGLFAKSFTGRNKGKLVWETRPTGQGFSKGSNNRITNSTQSTSSQNAYSNLGTTGLELKNVIDKQGSGTKVRVRVKYDPVLALTGQSYGPWRYLPAYLMGNSTNPVPDEEGNDLSEAIERKATHLGEGEALESATVYPNPVSNRLNIDFKDKDHIQSLRILTATGSVVYQSNELRSSVDVSKLSEGAYFLIITETDGSLTTRQILIRR